VKKLPRVAIVGFPNVGKSTLFNRLLNTKKSLVHSLPGMTRDAVSAVCVIEDKPFILTDTGGFFKDENDPFSGLVREKVWEVSREADILLFVLDYHKGLLPAEQELFFSLRKLNKPVFIVVNKVDSNEAEAKLGDFYRLGQDSVIPISAEHKRDLDVLEKNIYAVLPENIREEEPVLKIAVIGRINVGKSSLVNLLSGRSRQIVSEIPGTTRDSVDTFIRRNQRTYCIVDTAGIRKLSRTKDKREKAGIIKAKKDIRRADVIIQIMEAVQFPTRQDLAIAHLAHESGKPLILALNKWDLIPEKEKNYDDYRAWIAAKMDFVSYAPLVFISAIIGKRVGKLLDIAEDIYQKAASRVPTPKLNEFLAWINQRHPPINRKGERLKVRYIVQKGVLPPTFLLFTHSKSSLAPAYEKHLSRIIRDNFDFPGSPVRIKLRRN
jgi:GTP-binding protein